MEPKCKKCDSYPTIILRKKDSYCEKCFITSTNHKFRSSLGKNRVISQGDNVLVAITAGINSIVLMDLIHNGINLDNHKKFSIQPIFLHIIGLQPDSSKEIETANLLIKYCNKLGFDLNIVHISDINSHEIIPNIVPSNNQSNFLDHKGLQGLTKTKFNDYLEKIKTEMYLKVARNLDCKLIFTAETSANLATKLLSNITLGRGSQIEHDIGFMDSRNKNIKIVRPMKDMTGEEINYYCKIKHLTPVIKSELVNEISIQSLVRHFVDELDQNYPATVATVCKTAEKIGSIQHDDDDSCCNICHSQIFAGSKLTALNATAFSKKMCIGKSEMSTKENNEICFSCSKFNI